MKGKRPEWQGEAALARTISVLQEIADYDEPTIERGEMRHCIRGGIGLFTSAKRTKTTG